MLSKFLASFTSIFSLVFRRPGYPVGHTALLCLFSKIQKDGPQGRLLGWFGFSGSLARVLFPLTAGGLHALKMCCAVVCTSTACGDVPWCSVM